MWVVVAVIEAVSRTQRDAQRRGVDIIPRGNGTWRACSFRKTACKTSGEGGLQPATSGCWRGTKEGKVFLEGLERVGAEALRKNIAGEG